MPPELGVVAAAPLSNPADPAASYVLGHADRTLVLAQQLIGWITYSHDVDEDVAFANVALDLLGQARLLYSHVGMLDGAGRDEDAYAYWREPDQFLNPLIVEQPNGDFADTMVRQFLHDAYALELWAAMGASGDAVLAAVAGKAVKETRYHVRHSGNWVVRLGDGTAESHRRCQRALDALWPYVDELFDPPAPALLSAGTAPDPSIFRAVWDARVAATFAAAGLVTPTHAGPRRRTVDGHLGSFARLVGDMQQLAREHPGAQW